MGDLDLVGLCRQLYPLDRTLVSDGMDRALGLIRGWLPATLETHLDRWRPGEMAWTWRLPERWTVVDARLTDAATGAAIADYAANPLHLWSYSLPAAGDFTLAELEPHLAVGPEALPDALPWTYHYYERTWGFALSWNQRRALDPAGVYRVTIRTLFGDDPRRDGLAVLSALYTPPAEPRPQVVAVIGDVCHPRQVNDSITGAVAAVALAHRLVENPLPPGSARVAFVFTPEIIGSIAFLSRYPDAADSTVGAVFSEMLGHAGPLTCQLSRGGLDDRISRIASDVGCDVRPFRSLDVPHNDEIVWNGPGVNIPTVSYSRGFFPEYHTDADHPDRLSEVMLLDAVNRMELAVRTVASDYVPRRTFAGPLCLSAHGLWIDWRTDRLGNHRMEQLMLHLEGGESVHDISRALDWPYADCRAAVERLRAKGLVEVVR